MEDTSATDRLYQLLSDLSRIERSMAQIADTMAQIVPHISNQLSTEAFQEFEMNLAAALQLIIDRQKT